MPTYEVAYLDRDGTINVDTHYLSDPADFSFCDGAIEGLRKLAQLGLDLVVITNQSGISRGYFNEDDYHHVTNRMVELLAAEGIELAGIYHCPHGPDDACLCRKPLPGLIHQAEANLGARPGIMIGDSPRDVAAGKAAGLVTVGLFASDPSLAPNETPNFFATTLSDAADVIFNDGNELA